MAATKRNRKDIIPQSVKKAVIDYFHNNKDNTAPAIAEALNITKASVNWILDEHLNKTVKPKV